MILLKEIKNISSLFSFVLCVDAEGGIKDTTRRYTSTNQTMTPRHTIDAILGLKNRQQMNDGK